jgi:flavin-binding protein dodecin
MVYKTITLVGESTESFEDATEDAVDRAEETIRNIEWAEVQDRSVDLQGGERAYETEVTIAFELK